MNQRHQTEAAMIGEHNAGWSIGLKDDVIVLPLSGIGGHPKFTLWTVVSGEVILELADGAERALRPGDTIVQNGTAAAGRITERSQRSWLSLSSGPVVPATDPGASGAPATQRPVNRGSRRSTNAFAASW